MIVKIRSPKQSEKVKVVELYVTETGNGVAVKTVENDDYIVTITHGGTLVRHAGIRNESGLVLNDKGQIVEEEEV